MARKKRYRSWLPGGPVQATVFFAIGAALFVVAMGGLTSLGLRTRPIGAVVAAFASGICIMLSALSLRQWLLVVVTSAAAGVAAGNGAGWLLWMASPPVTGRAPDLGFFLLPFCFGPGLGVMVGGAIGIVIVSMRGLREANKLQRSR